MRRSLVLLSVVALIAVVGGGTAALAISKGTDQTVKPRHTALGTTLADGKGRTLYLFKKDTNNKSACSGACAVNWPPAAAGTKLKVGDGLDSAKLKKITRADGKSQVSYNGHPLYLFAGDKNKPGAVTGQGIDAFGAKWFAVGTDGNAVTKKATTNAPSAPAPSNSGY